MSDKNNNSITFSPEFANLKIEVARLKNELSMLILERDELQYVVVPNLEMEFILIFGSLDYKLYEVYCQSLRLKRKVDMVEDRVNRQESVDLVFIDASLDEEFKTYREELERRLNFLNDAIKSSKCQLLTDDEVIILKKLYPEIVKSLHPDLNSNLTPVQTELFQNVIEAFENGDIESIQMIHDATVTAKKEACRQDTLALLTHDKERLESQIKKIKGDIEAVQSRFPFNEKDILLDKAKIDARKKELHHLIGEYQTIISTYEQRLTEMVGDMERSAY